MWSIRPTSIQPIGVDIGCDTIKLLQLQVTGRTGHRRLSVVAAAKIQLPDPARIDPTLRLSLAADAINKALARQPFVGRDVVTSIGQEFLHVKTIRLPMTPPSDQLELAVREEAKKLFPLDPADARIEFLPVGDVRQGAETRQEVIVLAAANADIDRHVRQLEEAGLHLTALDTEITGLFRGYERFVRRSDDRAESQLLIEIGYRQTRVIVGKGRDIGFHKSIEIGGRHLLDVISRKLGITTDDARALRRRLAEEASTSMAADGNGRTKRDPVRQAVFDATRNLADELSREIAMCVRYFTVTFRGQRLSRAKLLGGEANDSDLRSAIEMAIDIPVQIGRPLLNVDTTRMRPADRRGSMSEWALAFGLGMRFVPGYFPPRDGTPRKITEARLAPAEVVRA